MSYKRGELLVDAVIHMLSTEAGLPQSSTAPWLSFGRNGQNSNSFMVQVAFWTRVSDFELAIRRNPLPRTRSLWRQYLLERSHLQAMQSCRACAR